MDIDHILACNEYLREENMQGYKALPYVEEDIVAHGLRSKGQDQVRAELLEVIASDSDLSLVGAAIQALGWTFDETYIPLYEATMRKYIDDDGMCHSCLIAIDNVKSVGLNSLSALEGSENAKRYFGLV